MYLQRCKHLFRSHYFDGDFSKGKEFTLKSVDTIHSHILKEENPMRIVQSFDRLSDTFCNLLDGLECVRNIHPNETARNNATNVFDQIAPTMYQMNSDKRLLNKIEMSLQGGLTGNALMVATSLKKEFQKAGAHLPDELRRTIEELNTKLQIVCSNFIQAGYTERERVVPINKSDIQEILPYLTEFVTEQDGQTTLKITINSGLIILSYCHNEALRRLAHLIVTNASSEQLQLFEEIIEIRYQLAVLQGFNSYTELTSGDRYLKTTPEIMNFIKLYDDANIQAIRPILNEMKKLGHLADWNTMYFMNQLHTNQTLPVPIKNQTSPFTVKTVLQGAAFALHHLFHIKLQKIEDDMDLFMHDKVEKYAVINNNGLLGYIYFDLLKRPGSHKLAEAAHFTIRCPRRVDWDRELSIPINTGKIWMEDVSCFGSFKHLPGEYQRPVVVLVTNYEDTELTFQEASTVFHELGHALHTMLGITDLQMLSGTRCLHDIAEVPSIFLEKMAVNPYLLAHVFGFPLDKSRDWFQIHNGQLPTFESPLEVVEDIWTSVVDQALHSDLIGKVKLSKYYTCGIVAGLQQATHSEFGKNLLFKEIEKEALNTRYASFPHLTGYGACYYSYLFARAIANKMHRDQNTFYSEPATWNTKVGLAEKFMSKGGYHSKAFLDNLMT